MSAHRCLVNGKIIQKKAKQVSNEKCSVDDDN